MAYNITPEYHQVAELDGCEGQKQQLLLNSLLQEPVFKTGIQKCKPLQQKCDRTVCMNNNTFV